MLVNKENSGIYKMIAKIFVEDVLNEDYKSACEKLTYNSQVTNIEQWNKNTLFELFEYYDFNPEQLSSEFFYGCILGSKTISHRDKARFIWYAKYCEKDYEYYKHGYNVFINKMFKRRIEDIQQMYSYGRYDKKIRRHYFSLEQFEHEYVEAMCRKHRKAIDLYS